jgi:hypothetical protein
LNNLIRQPLLHFFALGAALFVLFSLVNGDAVQAPDEIVVDADRVAVLVGQFERTWQRPPTRSELEGLVESWVREEILYREGLALGLDRDDPVVRRRVAQKIDFMMDSGAPAPDEAEIQSWFESNADNYRLPPQYAFEQVFFNPERHGDELETAVQEARIALESGDTAIAGDPTLLPARFDLASAPQIERSFGPDFVEAFDSLEPGRWGGPVRSSYGLHLVRIEQAEPGYLPALDDVRAAVERDLLQVRSEQAKAEFYQALRNRYDVRIESSPQLAGESRAD